MIQKQPSKLVQTQPSKIDEQNLEQKGYPYVIQLFEM